MSAASGGGLAGYVCPPGTPVNAYQRPGQRNAIDHCVGVCPNPCLSPPLLDAMYEAERRNPHKGAYISASMLTNDGCARQVWYERAGIDFHEVAKRRFWPFRGTICHALIEHRSPRSERAGWMQEIRMAVPLVYPELAQPVFDADGQFTGDFDSTAPLTITLGGTCDAYNPFKRLIHDFKTLEDGKLDKFLRGELGGDHHVQVKNAWTWQVNVYAWLVARTDVTPEHRARFASLVLPELTGDRFPKPERLQMQLITMMEPLLTATGRGYSRLRDPQLHAVDDVPVLDDAMVEAFIRPRALAWFKWLVLGQRPPLPPKDKSWLCRSCPFNARIVPNGPCDPREG